jgi:hypothetical protein
MPEYRVTFGQRYATETHPMFGGAHPDGWVTIIAPTRHRARCRVVEELGAHWCDLYGPDDGPPWDGWDGWDDEWWERLFPLGELARWVVTCGATLPDTPLTCTKPAGHDDPWHSDDNENHWVRGVAVGGP